MKNTGNRTFKRPSYDKNGPRRYGPRRDDKGSQPQGPREFASLWGVHAVTEAWLNPTRTIKKFFATEQALSEFQGVIARAQATGLSRPTVTLSDRAALDRMMPAGAVHQGLALNSEPLDEIFVADIAIRAASRPKSIIVMLDQVTDPHNVGAILRSASAFGAIGVVMQSRHAPELNGTLAKAACGAVEHIAVAYETNLSRAMAYLQEEGFIAIGLDERGEKTMADLTVPDKTLLVLGAEGRGLRQNLRENCNIVARLPTQGAILSLNVSNAAAVALYALVAV